MISSCASTITYLLSSLPFKILQNRCLPFISRPSFNSPSSPKSLNLLSSGLFHLPLPSAGRQTSLTKMSSSDLDQLVEMGFDKERAELSLREGRSCTRFTSSRKASRPAY